MCITLSCCFSVAFDSHLAVPTHGSKLKIKVVKICLLLIDFCKELSLDLVEDTKMFLTILIHSAAVLFQTCLAHEYFQFICRVSNSVFAKLRFHLLALTFLSW